MRSGRVVVAVEGGSLLSEAPAMSSSSCESGHDGRRLAPIATAAPTSEQQSAKARGQTHLDRQSSRAQRASPLGQCRPSPSVCSRPAPNSGKVRRLAGVLLRLQLVLGALRSGTHFRDTTTSATQTGLLLAEANSDANRLYEDLMMSYNRFVRPVQNDSETLVLKLGLKLSQLIDVNLRYQMMTTIVWMEQEWSDPKLKWDPDDYGGINKLHVPADDIWRPDLVLYNNADGDYVVTIMNKAILNSDGRIIWKPPAVYKSSCRIDVTYFPFDSQTCIMKFGTWTWNGNQIDLRHINQPDVASTPLNVSSNSIDIGIDLSDFLLNVEWDVMAVPATRQERLYECCVGTFVDITFNVTLRRKTLFYTINLISPCVVMSLLSILVFYLPSDSNEKVSLTISIVLSVDVFLLCLIEIIPPTSIVVPLLGQYLLFTLTLVTVSVVATVYVLNISFRNASSHKMSKLQRYLYLDLLPRILLMDKRFDYKCEEVCKTKLVHCGPSKEVCTCRKSSSTAAEDYDKEQVISLCGIHDEVKNAFLSLDFVAKRMENRENHNKIEEDWRYVATVIDRLLLLVFSTVCIVGTGIIILQAPLYDSREPIDVKLSKLGPKLRPTLPDSFDDDL